MSTYESTWYFATQTGVQKCGTSTLQRFLSTHARIIMKESEGNFFSPGGDWRSGGLSAYLKELPAAPKEMMLMEKSPTYFFVEGAAEAIASVRL